MSQLDPQSFMEPQPSAAEKALWTKFVDEYMKDFNPISACLRVGFRIDFAQEYAKQVLAKPFVQNLIMQRKSVPHKDDDSEKDRVAQLRARVEAVFIQAMETADAKTAVAAAAKLGEMHGFMEAPDKSGDELKDLVEGFKAVAKALPD
jgi:phage terminase small subunit